MNGQSWRRTEKVRRERSSVAGNVDHLLSELHDANPGARFIVAGSWRRQAPTVADLDILAMTPTGSLSGDLMEPGITFPSCITWDRLGGRIGNGYVLHEDGLPLNIDCWGVAPIELGGFLMFASGPARLNVIQRGRAKAAGKALSQLGVFDAITKERLDDGSERGCYAALGWTYLTPEERQRWADR